MTATEQARIDAVAPSYLRNIVVILSEMGLRPFKELLPMKKSQVDLDNWLIHIPDSKTVNGIGDIPMTPPVRDAFQRQIAETPGSEYLFPSPKQNGKKPYMTWLRKVWAMTLEKAGGVADHMVTQVLRQGDADVFKLYSQAKLGMMREALAKMDRQANERGLNPFTGRPN